MEWQIKTIARNSTLSGEAFKPGDQVVCFIFKGKELGELGRADPTRRSRSFGLPTVLGRWARVVKDPNDELLL